MQLKWIPVCGEGVRECEGEGVRGEGGKEGGNGSEV